MANQLKMADQQAIIALAGHPDQDIERACEIAQTHGAYRLRTIRELIKRQAPKQERFEFIQEHPIIRSLADRAGAKLAELGYGSVRVKWNDGGEGWEDEGPFDGIIITQPKSRDSSHRRPMRKFIVYRLPLIVQKSYPYSRWFTH